MKNAQERIVKLEKKLQIISEFLLNSRLDKWSDHDRTELARSLSNLDKLPEKRITLRKCPDCKHWWFTREQCGCYKFPTRYTYPTSKQHEVDEQKIPCEGFQMRPHRRLLRPIKGKSV
jgi:hypothetical protein